MLCMALLAPALAEDTSQTSAQTRARTGDVTETPAATSPALEVLPNRSGYAFDQPEILIRQRLFGLAHGLSLLAAACLDLPSHSQPIQDAYAVWHAKQGKTIEIIVHDLAQYYFGPRGAEARWPDLSRALNLGNSIEPALGEITLHAACASLPEAIVRPRYELDRMLTEGIDPTVAETAPPTAVAPAPTLAPAAE
jgi:hypothetical protein